MSKKDPPINLYKKIVVSFIGLTIILVLVVLYISFTEARIKIIPAKSVVSADVIIDIAEGADLDGVLRGKILETTVTGGSSFTPSGQKSSVSQVEGRVVIYNRYSKDQPLVKTTRLLSPEGLLFRLKETVKVPAGGQVEAGVYADEEGSKYEIGPAKFTIPGLWIGLQDKIYAESLEPMKGGTNQIKVVTGSDIENAKNALAEELFTKGKAELGNQGEISAALTFKEILASAVDAVPGEEMEEFNVDVTLRVISLVVDENKILAMAETKLRSSLPRDQKLVSINPDSVTYSLEKVDVKGKTANLKVYLEGIAALHDASLILNKERLAGLDKDEVSAYLTSFDAIENVAVNFYPFWIKKVPSLKDHIKIKIEY